MQYDGDIINCNAVPPAYAWSTRSDFSLNPPLSSVDTRRFFSYHDSGPVNVR